MSGSPPTSYDPPPPPEAPVAAPLSPPTLPYATPGPRRVGLAGLLVFGAAALVLGTGLMICVLGAAIQVFRKPSRYSMGMAYALVVTTLFGFGCLWLAWQCVSRALSQR